MPPVSEAFDVRLVSARMLSESVRELCLERVDGRAMEFLPGQWVNLVLPLSSGENKRAYSMASAPNQSPRFEIAVTLVKGGEGSAYLHSIETGAVLRAIGPQGFFTRAPDDREPALMVATGTGVTPLRSMIQAAMAAHTGAPIWLLFGARHEGDRIYGNEFQRYASVNDQFRHEVTLSRPQPQWTGRRGYVQEHLPELFSAMQSRVGGAPLHIYVCGLDRMVSAVRAMAKNTLGLDRKHIHHERYD